MGHRGPSGHDTTLCDTVMEVDTRHSTSVQTHRTRHTGKNASANYGLGCPRASARGHWVARADRSGGDRTVGRLCVSGAGVYGKSLHLAANFAVT